MRAAPFPPRRRCGFTLVELLIVVMILGILSAIVVPTMRSERREGVTSTLRSNVTQVLMVLEVQKQRTEDGNYPATLEPAWFVSGILPAHPDKMASVPAVEVVSTAGAVHPLDKVVHAGSAGAYWYNAANGSFRARVKEQASATETLDFYNDANLCGLDSLGATGGSGSGGGSGDAAAAAGGGGVLAAPRPRR